MKGNMSRYRIKTLLNVVWTVLDAEFEKAEAETFSLERMAKEIQFRHLIVETLENPALRGKRLAREVEALVQELVQMKRQQAGMNGNQSGPTSMPGF